MADSLVVSVDGGEQDGGVVSLADLNKFTADLQDCLKRVSTRLVGGPRVRHLVTELAVGSAIVGLRASSPAKFPDAGPQVYDAFSRTVRGLETGGEIDRRLRPDDLRAFRKLASPVFARRRVRIGDVDLTAQFIASIDKRLAAMRSSLGTVKGRVEKLNVHGRHEFTLFTAIGGHPVACSFTADLFDEVTQAVKRSVTVTGLCTYGGDEPFPDRVQVRVIEVHHMDDDLPTLGPLRGTFPSAGDTEPMPVFEEARTDGR